MPYRLTLQAFTLPDFYHEAPAAWVRRLREISPVTDTLAHLRFRYFDKQPHWFQPDRGIWALYSCTPTHQASRERAELFETHWSELHESEQQGRKASVSSYQHFMWHTQGVDVKPFLILQGEWGGTPAAYTRREVRYLDAWGALSEPFPLGMFAPCPFDERAVQTILERDRLIKVGNRFDELEQLDRPAALKAEDDLAEQEFRRKWLDTWYAMIQPQKEFMQSYLRTSESKQALPDAPAGLADAIAQWKDHYIEHGSVIGVTPAASRALAVAVP